jgi:hypothetical protein
VSIKSTVIGLGLGILGSTAAAQSSTDSSQKVQKLTQVVVQSEKEITSAAKLTTFRHHSPLLALKDAAVTTMVPGISVKPYLDSPFATKMTLAGQDLLPKQSNYLFTSVLPTYHLCMQPAPLDALHTGPELLIELKPCFEQGTQLFINPTRIGGAIGHVDEKIRAGFTAEWKALPGALVKRIPTMNAFGEGHTIYGGVELGSKRTVSMQTLITGLRTDYRSILSSHPMVEDLGEKTIFLTANVPWRTVQFKTVATAQDGYVHTEFFAVDATETDRTEKQAVRFYALETGAHTARQSIIARAYTLKKHREIDKMFSGVQIGARSLIFLGTQYNVEPAAKIDFTIPHMPHLETQGKSDSEFHVQRTPKLSLSATLRRPIGQRGVGYVTAGALYDNISPEQLGEAIEEPTPSKQIVGQETRYALIGYEVNGTNHRLRVEATPYRKITFPMMSPEAYTKGPVVRAVYMGSHNTTSWSIASALRNNHMHFAEGNSAVPGSSKTEVKAAVNQNIGSFLVNVTGLYRGGAHSPNEKGNTIPLGPQTIMTTSFMYAGWLSPTISFINIPNSNSHMAAFATKSGGVDYLNAKPALTLSLGTKF